MQEIKKLLGGKLRVHESRLDGSYSVSDSSKTLVEHLFEDGQQRFAAMVFRGNPKQCTKDTQVHPSDRATMLSDSGEFTIVETPAVSATAWAIASVVLSVASAAYAFYVASNISTDTTDTSTANRTISGRQNTARPLERIEDRAGKQLIYPTLIQKPYNKFESRKEVEISLMSVGVGEYDIDEDLVKDGDTSVSLIESEAACFYAPDTLPGDSADAFLTINDGFDEEVKTVYQSSEVSGGETLLASGDVATTADEDDLDLETVLSDTVESDIESCYLTTLNGSDQYYQLQTIINSTTGIDVTIRFAIHSTGIHPLIGRYYSSPAPNQYEGAVIVTYNSSSDQIIQFGDDIKIETDVLELDRVYEVRAYHSGGLQGTIELVGYDSDTGSVDYSGTTTQSVGLIGATSFDSSNITLTTANATILEVYWEDNLGFKFYSDLTDTTIGNTEGSIDANAINLDALDPETYYVPITDDVEYFYPIDGSDPIYVDSSVAFDISATFLTAVLGFTWGKITLNDDSQFLDEYLSQYDLVTIDIDATYGVGPTEVNLSGSYIVTSITESEMVIASPAFGDVIDVDADWQEVIDGNIDSNNDGEATIKPTDTFKAKLAGPYFLGGDDRNSFFANFVAESGLIKSDGGSQWVEVGVQYAECDSLGNRTSGWTSVPDQRLSGVTYNRIGMTIESETTFTGPMLFRCYLADRKTSTGTNDIALDALYGASPISVSDFGDITTVQTRTIAKGRATQVSERNFNLIAERKLPLVQSDGTIGTTNEATSRFIDYFAYACTDSKIGRQSSSDVDYQELYDQYVDIVDYFGSTDAAEFCYSFDNDQTSFQDHADQICAAAFSIPIRTGSLISSKFEQPGDARTIFTHRNKIPNSQTITRSFHTDDNVDGIEYQWVNPDDDDETATIYIPSDFSATKPEKVESVGVRNYNQAYWAAYRRYNKIINQRISIEDTLTAEGQLLSELDIVGITNDTNAPYYAGEVIGIDGLVLYLNQPVGFADGADHSISLRNRDGSIEIISCTEGPDSMSVTLASAPSETPYTDIDQQRTVFTLQEDDNLSADYYLVASVNRDSGTEIAITGYNYTTDFYANDTDTPS